MAQYQLHYASIMWLEDWVETPINYKTTKKLNQICKFTTLKYFDEFKLNKMLSIKNKDFYKFCSDLLKSYSEYFYTIKNNIAYVQSKKQENLVVIECEITFSKPIKNIYYITLEFAVEYFDKDLKYKTKWNGQKVISDRKWIQELQPSNELYEYDHLIKLEKHNF